MPKILTLAGKCQAEMLNALQEAFSQADKQNQVCCGVGNKIEGCVGFLLLPWFATAVRRRIETEPRRADKQHKDWCEAASV